MAKIPPPPKPTPAELDLLRVLWTLGQGTVREVHAAASRERPELAPATVLRLLQIMHGKGLLVRDERERSHVYAPAQPPDSLRTNLLKDLIQKAYSGSGKDLVIAALRGHVSQEEREEIRKLLHGEEP